MAKAAITDTYRLTSGSLNVTKTIAGPAAGQQGAVAVQAVCEGSTLSPALTVPAGAAAGTYSHTYHDIAAGSTCRVTEISDGSNHNVTVKVTGDGQHLTLLGGSTATAALTDTYSSAPGSLVVSKTIAGHEAGRQGLVSIRVVCGGTTLTPEFTLPAGRPWALLLARTTRLPAGSSCTVSELTNGATNTLSVTTVGTIQHVTVRCGQDR